jgi:hypothetical protein
MKRAKYLCLPFVVGAGEANCQVYSSGIVGYINQVLFTGDNLIANQPGVSNNTLNGIFQPGVPESSTFTEWDSATKQYLSTSVYEINNNWSINYELDYGQGGLLYSPSTFQNIFGGEVWHGHNPDGHFVPPLVAGSGSLLLSCFIPITDAMFYDVVGRDPQNGESVTPLNAASQIYTTTTFESDGWNNGVPTLSVGQAAFFNLEPVPEPAVYNLIGACLLPLPTTRKFVFKRIIEHRMN